MDAPPRRSVRPWVSGCGWETLGCLCVKYLNWLNWTDSRMIAPFIDGDWLQDIHGAGGLINWFIGCLFDWFIVWLINCLKDWLIHSLTDWLSDWLTDCLTDGTNISLLILCDWQTRPEAAVPLVRCCPQRFRFALYTYEAHYLTRRL